MSPDEQRMTVEEVIARAGRAVAFAVEQGMRHALREVMVPHG